MVKQRSLDNFCNHVNDLMSYIRKITPKSEYSYHSQIFSRYRKADKEQYLNEVYKYLEQYYDQISKFDEYIFTPEFAKSKGKDAGQTQIYFLVGYDFCKLWKHSPTAEQKRIIWRYLQLMFIHGSVALGKNKEKVTMLVENIKAEDEINKDAIANPNQFEDGAKGGSMDFAKLFGNNELLLDLAKDISSEINLEDTLKDLMASGAIKPGTNPMDMISNLCKNKEIQNVMKNLQEKVTKKMADRNLDANDLLASASALKNNFMSSLDGIPGGKQLGKMFSGMNLDKMMQQMSQNMPAGTGTGTGTGAGEEVAWSNGPSSSLDSTQISAMLNNLTNTLNANPETAQLLQQMSSVEPPNVLRTSVEPVSTTDPAPVPRDEVLD